MILVISTHCSPLLVASMSRNTAGYFVHNI
jgi:hypothetical protein